MFQINLNVLQEPKYRTNVLIIVPSPEQQTTGNMQQIYKACTEKCFDIKWDPHIALLQIRMTPLGLGLPSPATMLFNHPIRGIMPTISRLPIGIDIGEEMSTMKC